DQFRHTVAKTVNQPLVENLEQIADPGKDTANQVQNAVDHATVDEFARHAIGEPLRRANKHATVKFVDVVAIVQRLENGRAKDVHERIGFTRLKRLAPVHVPAKRDTAESRRATEKHRYPVERV